MQGRDNGRDDGNEDDGVGVEPIEEKSVGKTPSHHNTDSNPDKV